MIEGHIVEGKCRKGRAEGKTGKGIVEGKGRKGRVFFSFLCRATFNAA